jgi:hypothetical protein
VRSKNRTLRTVVKPQNELEYAALPTPRSSDETYEFFGSDRKAQAVVVFFVGFVKDGIVWTRWLMELAVLPQRNGAIERRPFVVAADFHVLAAAMIRGVLHDGNDSGSSASPFLARIVIDADLHGLERKDDFQ